MKKLLLSLMFALLIIGCKEKVAEKHEEATGAQKLTRTGDCTSYIIVDKSLIPSGEVEEWMTKYDTIICDQNDPAQNDIYIDLDEIGYNINSKAVGDWLKENGKYIDFGQSYGNIEKMHKIMSVPTADESVNEVKVTLSEIKDIIAARADYTGDKYDNYVKFTMQKNSSTNQDEVKIEVVEDYAPACKCFSIPFLRSIENNGTGDTDFYFNMGKFGNEPNSALYFRVGSTYYNYTRIPLGS